MTLHESRLKALARVDGLVYALSRYIDAPLGQSQLGGTGDRPPGSGDVLRTVFVEDWPFSPGCECGLVRTPYRYLYVAALVDQYRTLGVTDATETVSMGTCLKCLRAFLLSEKARHFATVPVEHLGYAVIEDFLSLAQRSRRR